MISIERSLWLWVYGERDSEVGIFGRLSRGSIGGVPKTNSAADALRLRTELALREANILTLEGKLTPQAVNKSTEALRGGATIRNPSAIKELTSDGSKVGQWQKRATPSVELSTGQRIRVHFYQNEVTGKVNYSIDFKVKGVVEGFSRKPRVEPKVPPYNP